MTDTRTDVRLTVRYFAAASAAAGVEQEVLSVPQGASIAQIVAILAERNADLARVLQRCSYLRDGIAVRDLSWSVTSGQTLDVLPPFAGG
jgi:molybdopterin synthase sulfur carrier subunit